MKKGCIFDFDDTLVETTIFYDIAKEKFAAKMLEIGSPVEESLYVLNQFDISNVLQCGGFHKECFPMALVQTYEYFCKKRGSQMCSVTAKSMEEIGWWVYEQPAQIIDGVEETLDRLKGRIPLYLATKGDQEIQKRRITQSGIGHYFEAVYIVPDKTPSEYLTIARENGLDPAMSWVIGNSMKGDINPGIRSGFNCIHVFHHNTWDFEEEEPVGKFLAVKSIRDAHQIVLSSDPTANKE